MTLDWALRGMLLLATGAAICRAFRGLSPAARHAIRRQTILATLVLPLIASMVPAWSIVNRTLGTADPAATLGPAAATGPAPVESTSLRERLARTGPATSRSVHAAAWAGSAGVGLYFLSGYLRLWRVRRRAEAAPARWTSAATRLAARSRLSRVPQVLVAPVASPCVTGILSPAVLIPPGALCWSGARLDAVLIHELAHIRRGDMAAQLASQALATLHWFNPLAWHALAAMRRERELACDEAVVSAGVAPVTYATELLAIARLAPNPPLAAAALSMARRSALEERLVALVQQPARNRRRWAGAAASLLLAAATVALAGAQVVPLDGRPGDAAHASSARAGGWTIPLSGGDDRPPSLDAANLAAGDPRVRERATIALAFSSGSDAVAPLLRALGDEDARVREKAAVGLAWRRDAGVADALVAAAADPEPRVREKVLVALAFSGDARASGIIDAARADADRGVRDRAGKLGRIR